MSGFCLHRSFLIVFAGYCSCIPGDQGCLHKGHIHAHIFIHWQVKPSPLVVTINILKNESGVLVWVTFNSSFWEVGWCSHQNKKWNKQCDTKYTCTQVHIRNTYFWPHICICYQSLYVVTLSSLGFLLSLLYSAV